MSTDYPIEMEPMVSMTREEMDVKVDEHFAFEAEDDVAGVWERFRAMWSTTSSVGRRADAGP